LVACRGASQYCRGVTIFPAPVGLGFASVLGPTRGRFVNVGNSSPLFVSWGDTPHSPPPGGLRPPGPLVFPPSLAEGLPAFWVPLVAGLTSPPITRQNFPPSLAGKGARGLGQKGRHPPQPPARGLRPLDPSFSHPRWPRVCRRFGSHSWASSLMWATRPLLLFWGHIPAVHCRGAAPPGPPCA